MIRFDNHAVFIGVDDYSTFDESMGAEKGTSDLPGSRNDALVFWRLQRQLGIPASNLRILTSPKVDIALLDGATEENVRYATEKEILDAASFLADRMADPSRPSGFFTFSGHGGWTAAEGLVLCPSDTSGPDLERAVSYATLHRIFAERRVTRQLTVLFDCCHSGARSPRADRIGASLSRLPVPKAFRQGLPLIGGRVLAACGPAEESYQARIGGVYRGAFSWAVSSVMDQWRATPHHGGVQIDISYGDLIERAGTLLGALSFEQTPVLRSRAGVAKLPIFHTGERGAEDDTTSDPSAPRYGGQLDPDCRYAVTFGSYVCSVLSTGVRVDPGYTSTYDPNTEYWSLTDSFVRAAEGASAGSSLSITQTQSPINYGSGGFPVSGALPTFSMPSSTVWTQMSSAPPASAFYSSQNGQYTGLLFQLNEPSILAPWGGTLTWYLAARSGTGPYLAGAYVASAGGLTLTKGSAPQLPPGYSWYFAQLTPLTWPTSTVDMQGRVHGAGAAYSSTSFNASLANKLWLAFTKSDNDHVHVVHSTDGVTYSPSLTSPIETGAIASYAPALAIVDVRSTGTLYLAYHDHGSSNYMVRWSTDGTTWSSAVNTGHGAAGSPALAAFGGQLCLAYTSSDGTCHIVTPADPQSSSSWSSAVEVRVGSGVTGAPAMTVFNRQLYVAFVGASRAIEVYRTTGGDIWTQTATLYGGLQDPSITVWNGFLYIACRDASSNVWVCSSPDGVTFSGYGELTSQVSAVTTGASPALCPASATALVLAYANTASSGNNFRTITAS